MLSSPLFVVVVGVPALLLPIDVRLAEALLTGTALAFPPMRPCWLRLDCEWLLLLLLLFRIIVIGVVDEFVDDNLEDIELPGLFTADNCDWLVGVVVVAAPAVNESIKLRARKFPDEADFSDLLFPPKLWFFFSGDVDSLEADEPTLVTEAVVEMGIDDTDEFELRYGDGVFCVACDISRDGGVVASGSCV